MGVEAARSRRRGRPLGAVAPAHVRAVRVTIHVRRHPWVEIHIRSSCIGSHTRTHMKAVGAAPAGSRPASRSTGRDGGSHPGRHRAGTRRRPVRSRPRDTRFAERQGSHRRYGRRRPVSDVRTGRHHRERPIGQHSPSVAGLGTAALVDGPEHGLATRAFRRCPAPGSRSGEGWLSGIVSGPGRPQSYRFTV